jgi:hypothetical protein
MAEKNKHQLLQFLSVFREKHIERCRYIITDTSSRLTVLSHIYNYKVVKNSKMSSKNHHVILPYKSHNNHINFPIKLITM